MFARNVAGTLKTGQLFPWIVRTPAMPKFCLQAEIHAAPDDSRHGVLEADGAVLRCDPLAGSSMVNCYAPNLFSGDPL